MHTKVIHNYISKNENFSMISFLKKGGEKTVKFDLKRIHKYNFLNNGISLFFLYLK